MYVYTSPPRRRALLRAQNSFFFSLFLCAAFLRLFSFLAVTYLSFSLKRTPGGRKKTLQSIRGRA